MEIIIKNSRSKLVKRQKACIDYVHKHKDRDLMDKRTQEAVKDFKRWTDESGINKDTSGRKHLGTEDWKPSRKSP